VRTVGFPYSISETFLKNNARQTLEEAVEILEKIKQQADSEGLDTVAYISMAFGNPYGDMWSPEEVIEGTRLITDMGIETISLADTVGMSDVTRISELVAAAVTEFPDVEIGVHLHSRPENAEEKILAAWDSGCRRFDSAIGGLGGCPFAQDLLVGNIPTEAVLRALASRNVPPPIRKPLDPLLKMTGELTDKHAAPVKQ